MAARKSIAEQNIILQMVWLDRSSGSRGPSVVAEADQLLQHTTLASHDQNPAIYLAPASAIDRPLLNCMRCRWIDLMRRRPAGVNVNKVTKGFTYVGSDS
jgi:hypothetical protein